MTKVMLPKGTDAPRTAIVIPFGKQFSAAVETDSGLKNTYWVQTLTAGDYQHMFYGEINITEMSLSQMLLNFKNNVYGQELPIDYEHGLDSSKGLQAAGWVRDMSVATGDDAHMKWLIEFTQDALDEIRAGKWKYFSAEFADVWEDNQGQLFTYVAMGGGITNRPFLKGMTPLNFSELVVERPVGDVNGEWVYQESHEPGTDPDSQPVLPWEPDEAAERGSRRDTPPIVEEIESEASMNEFLKKLAERLGITVTDDMDDTKLSELIGTKYDELDAEVAPLREAAKDAESRKSFRESFPDEYDELQAAKQDRMENNARKFSDRFKSIEVEGKPSGKGLSALALSAVQEAHVKLSTRSLTHDDLATLLSTITDKGIVDYTESGSSRSKDTKILNGTGEDSPKHMFSALVAEVMEEDSLEYNAAVREAAKRDPDLFEAYRNDRAVVK